VPRNWTGPSGEVVSDGIIGSYGKIDDKGASQMASASWQAILQNHTRFARSEGGGDNKAYQYVGKCEMAIVNHATDTKYCPDDADTIEQTLETAKVNPNTKGVKVKDSYVGDCGSCRQGVGDSGMSFSVGGDTKWSKTDKLNRCLNYFVGHMRTECLQTNASACTCKKRFDKTQDNGACKGSTKAADNIKEMVKAAYAADSTSAFCNYPDLQCKQKIQNSVESSLTTIAVFGVIFVLFFLGIIFFTLQAIHIYRGGGDDDDDDDDDDE